VFSLRLLDVVFAASDGVAAHGGNVAPPVGDARLLLLAEDGFHHDSPLLCETPCRGDPRQEMLCRALEVGGNSDRRASGSWIDVPVCGRGSQCGGSELHASDHWHARNGLVGCDSDGAHSIPFRANALGDSPSAVAANSRSFFANLVVPLAGMSRRASSVGILERSGYGGWSRFSCPMFFPPRKVRLMMVRALALSAVAMLAGAFAMAAEVGKAPELKCPVAGTPIKADKNADYKGGKVNFCCDNCKAKFAADPAKYSVAANLQLIQSGQAKQEKCPLSGGPLDATKTVEVAGTKVTFCCEKCQGKVAGEKDAAKQKELVFSDTAFDKAFKVTKK
jgi:YHS domain-containing protein